MWHGQGIYGMLQLACCGVIMHRSLSGVYVVIAELPESVDIRIGRRRKDRFETGFYGYVGSALNNLKKRIERHKSKEKKMHWHIDYLLSHARVLDIKTIITDKKIECKLAGKVKEISDEGINGFGCSDCNCSSHLLYFEKMPILKNMTLQKI